MTCTSSGTETPNADFGYSGNWFDQTTSGQGYRFTLPVTIAEAVESKAQAAPKHNLPSQLTSFIGREQEIAQLKELLAANRLVTLTGAGGAHGNVHGSSPSLATS